MRSVLFFLIIAIAVPAAAQQARSLEVTTLPEASVWLDGVLRGTTDKNGKLLVSPVSKGAHIIRIRAYGFKEVNQRIGAAQAAINAPLTRTFDRAEIAFQNAEKMMSEDKERAVELYREALALNPAYAPAHVGLARALADTGDYQSALSVVKNGRRIKPSFPELSAVEGRIHRSEGEIDKAIESFERAIREGRGFQPEAHTGLGLIFKDEAEAAKARTDYDEEQLYYEDAAKSLETALDQLSATEPVVYLLLGEIYEKSDEKIKAIAVYRRFLRDLPDHEETTAVESFIEQLEKSEQE